MKVTTYFAALCDFGLDGIQPVTMYKLRARLSWADCTMLLVAVPHSFSHWYIFQTFDNHQVDLHPNLVHEYICDSYEIWHDICPIHFFQFDWTSPHGTCLFSYVFLTPKLMLERADDPEPKAHHEFWLVYYVSAFVAVSFMSFATWI